MLCIDLFCGLGGWAEGFLAEGFTVIGFDIVRMPYPGFLVLQDVRRLHGSQFSKAACLVASPPCNEYSYRGMPWKRAKALPPPSNELFDTCFLLQREASEAGGRYIPMIVENVRAAQKWVGPARWHFGSYYLWGDVPALMPLSGGRKLPPEISTSIAKGRSPAHWTNPEKHYFGRKVSGIDWGKYGKPGYKAAGFNSTAAQRYREGIKQEGSGEIWFDTGIACLPSHSNSRKAASALIAKIPFPLARHIARYFKECARTKEGSCLCP